MKSLTFKEICLIYFSPRAVLEDRHHSDICRNLSVMFVLAKYVCESISILDKFQTLHFVCVCLCVRAFVYNSLFINIDVEAIHHVFL